MANRIADYAFYFTDSNFQIVDKLNLHLSYSRSSFQDFCVSGDAIISIPYMQREGYMNVLDVYSISRQKRLEVITSHCQVMMPLRSSRKASASSNPDIF